MLKSSWKSQFSRTLFCNPAALCEYNVHTQMHSHTQHMSRTAAQSADKAARAGRMHVCPMSAMHVSVQTNKKIKAGESWNYTLAHYVKIHTTVHVHYY